MCCRDISKYLCLFIGFLVLTCVGCGNDDPATPDSAGMGSVDVNPAPDILNAPWVLVGPDYYVKTGNGNQTVSNIPPGDYSISWGAIEGWYCPLNSTRRVRASGTTVFAGSYLEEVWSGTIEINPDPDSLNAPWSLSGPREYSNSGNGDQVITGLLAGEYTLTWNNILRWTKPASSTQRVDGESTATFAGLYIELPPPVQEFIQIPPDSVSMPAIFTMGCSGYAGESPRRVTLTRRFIMSSTEVTNAQYISALQWAYDEGLVTVTTSIVTDNIGNSSTPLLFLAIPECLISFEGGVFSTQYPDRPVEGASWYGSAAYCDWLSLQENLTPAYDHNRWICNYSDPYSAVGYRLPTEAEWEFACRAGTTTLFSTGDCLDSATEANYDGSNTRPGCPSGPNLGSSADFGSYLPNPWGLFDMHGNVYEWCNALIEGYSANQIDPVGNGAQSGRPARGGCWVFTADFCRSSAGLAFITAYGGGVIGFRPVRTVQ